MVKKTETPNFVQEYSIGKTRIKVADNYCRDKTPEQVEAILKRISRFVTDALIDAEVSRSKAK